MESQDNARFVDFQASTKYFFDTAGQCFDHCIKNFEQKDLTAVEKNCVNTCFTKQMVVYGNLCQNLNSVQDQK